MKDKYFMKSNHFLSAEQQPVLLEGRRQPRPGDEHGRSGICRNRNRFGSLFLSRRMQTTVRQKQGCHETHPCTGRKKSEILRTST